MTTLREAMERVRSLQRQRKTTKEQPPVEGGSLPTWVVRGITTRPGGLVVQCPRQDCQQAFIVDPHWPRGGYATRPCPYCFKTAKLPPRLRRITTTPRRTT